MAKMGIPRNSMASAGTRMSPGVYRSAQGSLTQNANGMVRKPVTPPAATPNPNIPKTGGPLLVDTGNGTNQPTPTTPPDMNALNQQRQRILGEVHRRGGLPKATGFAGKLNEINSQIRSARSAPPAAGTPPPEATIPPGETQPTAETPPSDSVTSALYPSLNYQLPENYEGSPMYKFQMQEGTTALNRKLAQRGLLDSGAELESTNRLSQAVGAQESDRLRGDMQTEADRFERVSGNEANRRVNQENSQWNRKMEVFNSLNKQSPMNDAYNGLNKVSDLDMKRGSANAANTANNYGRVSGGGRRTVAPFVPPGASGPDYSQIDLMNSIFGNSSSRGNGNILDSFLGSFLG